MSQKKMVVCGPSRIGLFISAMLGMVTGRDLRGLRGLHERGRYIAPSGLPGSCCGTTGGHHAAIRNVWGGVCESTAVPEMHSSASRGCFWEILARGAQKEHPYPLSQAGRRSFGIEHGHIARSNTRSARISNGMHGIRDTTTQPAMSRRCRSHGGDYGRP